MVANSKHAVASSSKARGGAAARDLESFGDIADDVIESDFVPYACLFDPSTIATKDGELVQTIKITGLHYDAQRQGNLRQAIREVIREVIPDDSYAIWLHTLRRRQTALARPHYPDAFSGKIDEAWRALQPSSVTYVNELYITLVKAGEAGDSGGQAVFRSLHARATAQRRTQAMDAALRALSAVTARMVTRLSAFGAKQLTMVERNGVFYSEQLEFLEKLINLEERPMPVPERDLSHVLTSGEITFGFNAMEVRSADGVRRFAALLTLKEYKESTLAGIDKFLEIPCELIVSQCFDFSGGEAARASYAKQASYLTHGGDKELAQWTEIDRLMNAINRADNKSFGQQQTTLFLIAPSINQLESHMRMVQRSLNRLGLVVVREDLRFEECYWSQLPANFAFISRRQPVDTEHLAGFVNLQAAPMGQATGSPWGAPVTTFTTLQDAPYYFNFHRQQSAHTILLGNPHSGRTTFAHFLLAQARKLPVSIWYLDAHGRGAPFIQAMGGQCFTPGSAQCGFNPFLMPHTQANEAFLALWVSTLIDPSGQSLNQSTLAFFQSVVARMMALPADQRRMHMLAAMVAEADAALGKSLQRFMQGGVYGSLFDAPVDHFSVGKLSLWDLGAWMADAAVRAPLTAYLLHRLTGALDGTPTLLVLDEGFRLLDTPLFSARISGWLDHLSQQNAACFVMTDAVEASATYAFTPAITSKAATIFAMADANPGAGYAMGFGFTPEATASLAAMNREAHPILQRRGEETVVIKTNLGGLPPATLATLRGVSAMAPPAALSAADTLAQLMGYTKQVV